MFQSYSSGSSTSTAQVRSAASSWSKDDTFSQGIGKIGSRPSSGGEGTGKANEKTPDNASVNNKTSGQPSLVQETSPGPATTPLFDSGFYEKRTLWEQEVHRYKPSFWLVVRVGSLIAYPYLMSFLGEKIWPRMIDFVEYLGLEMSEIAVTASGVITVAAFFTLNVLYAILYLYDIPLLDQYRIDEKPWHWEMDPVKWNEMVRSTIAVIGFNTLCLSPLISFTMKKLFGNFLRHEGDTLPGGAEIFLQIMMCTVLEDCGFHHVHQLLHTKHLYWIHKVHHRYHAPIGISSVYAHPIEYVFGNIMPSMLGPLLLQKNMHAWTFSVWFIFRSSAALENHSGYEFPWSMFQAIPFKAPTEYHDFHHNKNLGTYSGVLRIWDFIYGTNRQYFEWVRAGRPQRSKKIASKKQS